MKEFKDFYDTLRENLQNFRGEYDGYIDYGPELYKLLVNLLGDKKVKPKQRLLISAALAYFIAPLDVIPEEIYGPFGYVDDIFICVYVLKKLDKELGFDFLVKHWEGEDELKEVLDECYNKSKEVVKDKVNEILLYVGLK